MSLYKLLTTISASNQGFLPQGSRWLCRLLATRAQAPAYPLLLPTQVQPSVLFIQKLPPCLNLSLLNVVQLREMKWLAKVSCASNGLGAAHDCTSQGPQPGEPLLHFPVNQLMTASPSEGRVSVGPAPTHMRSTACWNPSTGQWQSWSQHRADEDVTRPGDEVPQTSRHGPQKSPLPTGLKTPDGEGEGKQVQSPLPAAPSAAVSPKGKQRGLSIHLPSRADSLCSRVHAPGWWKEL